MLLSLEIRGIKIIFMIIILLVLMNEYTSFELMIVFGDDISAMLKYLRCILYVYIGYGISEYFLGLKKYENFLIAKIVASLSLILVFLKLYYHYYLKSINNGAVSLVILFLAITIAQVISILIMSIKIKLVNYNNLALFIYLLIIGVLILMNYIPIVSIYNIYYYIY